MIQDAVTTKCSQSHPNASHFNCSCCNAELRDEVRRLRAVIKFASDELKNGSDPHDEVIPDIVYALDEALK